MSKLDELRRLAAGNVDDSMGIGRPPQRAELSSPVHGAPTPPRWQGVAKSKNAAEVPIDRIGPDPGQPREEFEPAALARLAESMKARGQLQPIRVRWDEGQGRYVIICGERRWRAAAMAGLKTMTCVIAEGPVEPGELLALQLIENCVREDLKPIEQARAFKALMDTRDWSVSRVARELAIDHSGVSRALALLTLPESVQAVVEQGALPPATAYEVSKLDDPDVQREVAGRVVAEGLSRSETIEAVKRAASERSARTKGRGAAKGRPRKVTARTFRVDGYKLVAECRKGVDPKALAGILRNLASQLDSEAAGIAEGQGGPLAA